MKKYMDNIDIIKLIPSKDMQEYLIDISYTFSDSEKATIVSNVFKDQIYQYYYLCKDIADTTDDLVLRDNIYSLLDYIKNFENTFKQSNRHMIFHGYIPYKDNSYFAELYSQNFYSVVDLLSAIASKLDTCDKEDIKGTINIEKIQMFDEAIEKIDTEYSLNKSTIVYDLRKNLVDIWDEDYNPKIINTFIDCGVLFERGDIVEIVGGPYKGDIVIIDSSPDKKIKYLKSNDESMLDYNSLEFLAEKYDPDIQEFCHCHYHAFDAEKLSEGQVISYPNGDILLAAANVIKGIDGSLEALTMLMHN